MSDRYREELIQVAAVAVAMIECRDRGAADDINTLVILDEIRGERYKQNRKWGAQTHDPEVWLAILMEEVGEAAQAWLKETYEGQ